jgi:hypothetical protein
LAKGVALYVGVLQGSRGFYCRPAHYDLTRFASVAMTYFVVAAMCFMAVTFACWFAVGRDLGRGVEPTSRSDRNNGFVRDK